MLHLALGFPQFPLSNCTSLIQPISKTTNIVQNIRRFRRDPIISKNSNGTSNFMSEYQLIWTIAETFLNNLSNTYKQPRQPLFPIRTMFHTMGLIYQSNVETSADPSAQINLRQSSRVIYETFVCRQSHRTKDRTLINVAAENNRHLNITPLKTPRFRSLASKVYDMEKHNPAK